MEVIVQPREWSLRGDNIYLFCTDTMGKNVVVSVDKFAPCWAILKYEPGFKTIKSSLIPHCHLSVNRYQRPWQQDRTDKLIFLFKYCEISPYSPIRLTGMAVDDEGILVVDINNIEPVNYTFPSIYDVSMFFDIEVRLPNGDFPSASTSEIFMICLIFQQGDRKRSHIITTEDCDEVEGNMMHVVDNEKQLLATFYELCNVYSPTRMFHYNGYGFDMPYIVQRTKINQLHPTTIGFLEYGYWYRTIKLWKFGQAEIKNILLTPGVTNVDLLMFFRRFYPNMTNHTLDTVSNYFLGVGKTDMSIDRMREILSTKDPQLTKQIAQYCYIDTLRLSQLEQKLNIFSTLRSSANGLKTTIEQLLMMTDAKLIKSIIYGVDHTIIINPIVLEELPFKMDNRKGVFKDVKVYDTSSMVNTAIVMPGACEAIDLMRQGKTSSGVTYCGKMHLMLKHSPPGISMRIAFSNYSSSYIRTEIMKQIRSTKPISITTSAVYTDLEQNLPVISTQDYRFVIDSSNYSAFENRKFIHHVGLLKKHRFKLMEVFLEAYYINMVNGIKNVIEPSIFDENLLKIVAKVKPVNSYSSESSDGYRIAKMLDEAGDPIRTWRTVEYYYTVNDGIVISSVPPPDIDYAKYLLIMESVTTLIKRMFSM